MNMLKKGALLLAAAALLAGSVGCADGGSPEPAPTAPQTEALTTAAGTDRPAESTEATTSLTVTQGPVDTTVPDTEEKPTAGKRTTVPTATGTTASTRRKGGRLDVDDTTTASTSVSTKPAAPEEKWELYWSEEFEGDELDSRYWNCEGGDRGNYYFTTRPENVRVENGQLILTAQRENYRGKQYTSASVSTARKFSFCYGRLEFRARLPYGQGIWPALWTMGDDYLDRGDELGWPYAGEIDVMEMIGGGGEAERSSHPRNKRSTCNLHWGKDRDNHAESFAEYILDEGILADKYHLFAVEWDEDKISWFVDDVKIHEVGINDPAMMDAFHKPHWLILGIGLADFEPAVNEITPFPQSMFVDYVRVYKPKNG